MPNLDISPEVYLIGQTAINREGMNNYLSAIGAGSWSTAAHSDAEELIEVAGKSCYLSFDLSLNSNLTRVNTRDNFLYIKESILKTKHFSVIEHGHVNFGLVNVSRVFTHELVRHRHLTFSQVSGRYVRTDQLKAWLPSVIRNNPKLVDIFDLAFSQMEQNVKALEVASGIEEMKDFTLKKTLTSAFRRIIGNGQSNHIVVSGNHRSWREIIALRTDTVAEEEIRIVFCDIYNQLSSAFPGIYSDANKKDTEDGLFHVTFG